MALTVNTQTSSAGVVNFTSGQLTQDATAAAAVQIPIGFLARRVRLLQVAGTGVGQQWEWNEGMAPGTCLLTSAAGAATISTTAGPTVAAAGITFPAAAMIASSSFIYEAHG